MTIRYKKKKGGYRSNSYNILDCYKLILKNEWNIIKFITPKQKKKDGHPLNDYYTVVMSNERSSPGQQIKVHIKEEKNE